jgi:hypothetical protein
MRDKVSSALVVSLYYHFVGLVGSRCRLVVELLCVLLFVNSSASSLWKSN